MSFKVWRIAAGLALVCTLAAGVAAGAFMEVDGDPVDYVKIRLWKEDGALKSEFRGVETEFGKIAGDFRRIAGQGHADWPVHWLVGGEVTVGELSAKMGALAALGFTNQFFMAVGATERQVLEFDLGNAWEWPEEVFQGEEELREETLRESWRIMEKTKVPRMEFVGAAPRDVLEWLSEAEGKLAVRVEPEDALEGAPPLTMRLEGASLAGIARAVGEALGLRAELEVSEDCHVGWVFRREEGGPAAARQDGDEGGSEK